MRVEPDDRSAQSDQAALVRIVRSKLVRAAGTPRLRCALDHTLPARMAGEGPPPLYPGLVAAASPAGLDSQLAAVLDCADSSARRAHEPLAATWQVDLTPAEPHLSESVRRALAQLPHRPDRTPTAEVAGWRDDERAVADAAATLIRRVWPAMFAELVIVVRQLALLAGPSIHGFTDFATHGAVYVNRTRLGAGRDGLPGHVRLAEALVHEGTHNRCNVASLSTRFLSDDGSAEERLDTPLRTDPRPMAGLFQQIVVVARSLRLYDLVLTDSADPDAADPAATDRDALTSRRDTLREQGIRGLATARAHAGALSATGQAVLDQADALLCRTTAGRR